MTDWPHPPYRIRTERLLLRCYELTDAPAVREVTLRNLEHLSAWMPWTRQEPQTLEEKRELLRRFRGHFDLGFEFTYGIFDRQAPHGSHEPQGAYLGGAGLHPRCGPGGLELGYWVAAEHGGRGYATEAAAALVRAAFDVLGVDRVEVRVQPENTRSLAIPRRLGFRREAELARRLVWPGEEPRDLVLWTLWRSDFAGSPAARLSAGVALEDGLGRPLPPLPAPAPSAPDGVPGGPRAAPRAQAGSAGAGTRSAPSAPHPTDVPPATGSRPPRPRSTSSRSTSSRSERAGRPATPPPEER